MANLDHCISLRSLMQGVRVENGDTIGTVAVDAHVRGLVDALYDHGLSINAKGAALVPHALRNGDVIEVRIESAMLNFYERFDDYLHHFPADESGQRYYIYDAGFASDTVPVPELLVRYRRAIRLWRLLKKLSDHVDNRRTFLLSTDKLEVVCAFKRDDLSDLPKLERLEADFADDSANQDEKRTLFKRALQDLLGACQLSTRFGTLLRNSSTVYDRYWQNLRLYLEGISFDKIFESYVEKHAKLITEFNSVLGGIQTAVIGLPIASFVILEKMTVAAQITFKNTMLLTGCLVFVGFLTILSFSQQRTLDAAKALAKELNDEVKAKNPDLAARLAPSMGRLSRHAGWVTTLLFLVRALLVGLVAVTIMTYCYVTFQPIRDAIDSTLRTSK